MAQAQDQERNLKAVRNSIVILGVFISGCTHTQDTFKCRCDCINNKFECTENESKIEVRK
jgi:hypothetical protein